MKLECVSEEKDLGVIISEELKCEKQCSEAVKKANRCWEWLNEISSIDLKKQ